MINNLFTPCRAGALALSHRVVLAPMTRTRAVASTLAPGALSVEYYRQRASSGGLLISEATYISAEATPIWTIYAAVAESGGLAPGIWTDEQTRGWAAVTDAVHAGGAKISCQLLHAGRVAQPEIGEHPIVRGKDCPLPPVSSSSVPMESGGDKDNQYYWNLPSVAPRALTTEEIARVCRDYRHAAANALRAGFDCVELHAAHGYLVDQFICDGVNNRTDPYGGSVENRCRFLLEAVTALIEVAGKDRVGVRLSPTAVDPRTGRQNQSYFGVTCSDGDEIYAYAISRLNELSLAYLLLTEPRAGGLSAAAEEETAYVHPLHHAKYREIYRGTLIGVGGFTPQTAAAAVGDGVYDMIAFGRWFLSNPDLPERIKQGDKLNVYDRSTFYGGGAEGYTDYPSRRQLTGGAAGKYRLMEQDKIGPSLR